MNIHLSPQQEDWVRAKVASGLYGSASEVVREALQLMDSREQQQATQLEQLRGDIRDGLESGPSEAWNAEALKLAGRALREGKTA